jgi:hypothetical protein
MVPGEREPRIQGSLMRAKNKRHKRDLVTPPRHQSIQILAALIGMMLNAVA